MNIAEIIAAKKAKAAEAQLLVLKPAVDAPLPALVETAAKRTESVAQGDRPLIFPDPPEFPAETEESESEHNGTDFIFSGDVKELPQHFTSLEAVKKDEVLWTKLTLSQRIQLPKVFADYAKLAGLRKEPELPAQGAPLPVAPAGPVAPAVQEPVEENSKSKTFSLSIELNEKQQLAVDYSRAGKCFVLTGAAGTGKTTACREVARTFIEDPEALGSHSFKVEGGHVTAPGIAFVSYTRRATANIRRALHADASLEERLAHNVVTIHKLLEYQPVFFMNSDTGKTTMRFEPQRTAQNPLTLRVLVIEEASMLGLDLWEKLYDALRPGCILIFVGDINQLPPVFGKSIMNYALAQLPIVELTEVYRQALDSGIIVNAHRILKGEVPVANKDTEIITGKSPTAVGQERMARALGAMFYELWQKGAYDEEQDIILSPWNKQPLGTNSLNNWIAQFLGEKRDAMVYEVLAGRRTMYIAVGDRVMYEKRDGVVTKISHNAQYLGRPAQPAGTDLTRFGVRKVSAANAKHEDFEDMVAGYGALDVDAPIDEEKKLQASHSVTLTLDDGEEVLLNAVGDFAEQVFSLGYCLTVHKAQGCEWRKLFLVLHEDHNLGGFLDRELLYTAVTRAREKLVIIAKDKVLAKAVKAQSIKGNTLQEKIQSINSGAQNIGAYKVTK